MKTSTTLLLALMVIAAGCPDGGSGSPDTATTASGTATGPSSGGDPGTGSASSATDTQEPTTSGTGNTSSSGGVTTSSSTGPGTDTVTVSSTGMSSETGMTSGTGMVSDTGSSSETGLVPGVCGDGVHNLGEECDDGNFDNTDACTEYCLAPTCGDGYIQPGNGETCDDGNQTDGDGCNVDCFQSGDTVWTVTFDGVDHLDDHGHAVAVDGAGAVVIAGSTTVPGEDTNIFLWKVDGADGGEVWHRDIVGPGPDVGYDIDTNSANELAVTGSFYVGAQPDPGGKIWTAGFAPNGNEIWSGTTMTDGTGKAIVVAPDDSVYTTGDITGTYGPNLWIERRDAAGAVLWTEQDVYGDDSSCDLHYHENPEGIAVDPPHVYVAWRSTCPGGQFPAAPRSKVSRFTEDGMLTFNPDACCTHWRIDVFSPGVFSGVPTRAFDMARGPDDSLVIAGEANNGGYLWGYGADLYSTQTYNAAHWEGTPGGARFVDAAIDGAGNIVLAGDGGRVVKTAPAGQLLWQKTEPGLTARGVAVDDDGYIYVVGSIAGQGTDVWLRKMAP